MTSRWKGFINAVVVCQLSPETNNASCANDMWEGGGGRVSKEQLTKVYELLHGQRRWRELCKPLHLLQYSADGAIFQQYLSELHFFSFAFVDPVCQWSEDKVSFLSSPSSSLTSVNLAGLRLGVAQDDVRYKNIFRCIQGVFWSRNSAHLGQVVECPSNVTSSDERALLLLDGEGVGLMVNQPMRGESLPALYVVEHAENTALK